MAESKEKLSNDRDESEKEEKIPPLSLNTPDLMPHERKLYDSASEKLVKAQIDRMFQEDPSLRKEAEKFPPLPWGEEVPEEFQLKDLKSIRRQESLTEKQKQFFSDAFKQKALDEISEQISEFYGFNEFVQEFRRGATLRKFELYYTWLTDVGRIYRNQSITLESLSPDDQASFKNIIQSVNELPAKLEDPKSDLDNIAFSIASVLSGMTHILKKFGVPDSQLTRGAFVLWLNAKSKSQEA